MQSGLPADAASLRETGSVDRYIYTALARVPSNSIASCGAVSCLINVVADGAEGLHSSYVSFTKHFLYFWPLYIYYRFIRHNIHTKSLFLVSLMC